MSKPLPLVCTKSWRSDGRPESAAFSIALFPDLYRRYFRGAIFIGLCYSVGGGVVFRRCLTRRASDLVGTGWRGGHPGRGALQFHGGTRQATVGVGIGRGTGGVPAGRIADHWGSSAKSHLCIGGAVSAIGPAAAQQQAPPGNAQQACRYSPPARSPEKCPEGPAQTTLITALKHSPRFCATLCTTPSGWRHSGAVLS